MKIFKTEPEIIKERIVIDKEICDICKNEIKKDGFDESVVNLNAKIGNIFPEGDLRDYYIIDVCPRCFLDKLKPLIEGKFGVRFREMSEDNNEDFSK